MRCSRAVGFCVTDDRNRVIVGPPGDNGYINASFVQVRTYSIYFCRLFIETNETVEMILCICMHMYAPFQTNRRHTFKGLQRRSAIYRLSRSHEKYLRRHVANGFRPKYCFNRYVVSDYGKQ